MSRGVGRLVVRIAIALGVPRLGSLGVPLVGSLVVPLAGSLGVSLAGSLVVPLAGSLGVPLAGSLGVSLAHAQDFTGAAPPVVAGSVLAALEDGIPVARPGPGLELGWTSRFGIPELDTRAAAAGGSWRSLRLAAGLAQSGDEELGWNALGAGIGTWHRAGGAGLRAALRRDRTVTSGPAPLGRGIGLEVGGGAWVETGAVHLWVAGPQVLRRGVDPPLRRGLELGGGVVAQGLAAWCARVAPAGPGSTAVRRAGVGIVTGGIALWVEARDRPLRGLLGVGARRSGLGLSATVESHPVLGETTRITLAVGRGGAR